MFDKRVIRLVVPVHRGRMYLHDVLSRVVLVSSPERGVIDVNVRSKVTVGRATVRDRVSPVLSPSTSQKDAKVAHYFFGKMFCCTEATMRVTTMQLYSAWVLGFALVIECVPVSDFSHSLVRQARHCQVCGSSIRRGLAAVCPYKALRKTRTGLGSAAGSRA